jgi:hypothetical protein
LNLSQNYHPPLIFFMCDPSQRGFLTKYIHVGRFIVDF